MVRLTAAQRFIRVLTVEHARIDKEVDMKAARRRVVIGLRASIAVSLILALCPLAISHAGDSLVGKVVAVTSANLVALDYGAGTQEVRIAGVEVDTRDVMAREAKTALSNLILGKTVRLRFDGYLPNGEMTGRIWLGGIGKPEEAVKDVGVELVRAGLVRSAKEYREYKYGEMNRAEAEARQSKRGLWR